VGLATVRRDGFGYLAPQNKNDSAQLVSRLLETNHAAARWFINVDVTVHGFEIGSESN